MVCDCKLPNRSTQSVILLIIPDFLLTKGNVTIRSLYVPTKANKNYWYHGGVNIQAVIAYCVGIALPFPGFCGELGASVSTSAAHIMDIAWLTAFTVSFVTYYVICKVWPTASQREVKLNYLAWEQLGSEGEYFDSSSPKDEEYSGTAAVSSHAYYEKEQRAFSRSVSNVN